MLKSKEIRQKYLSYFESQNHVVINSAPVVPENDPTVLFNTAWMQPLVPYLMGQKHPNWTRLTDSQKCIRTNDIEEVWDDSHLTFFEMLWNWSLWDYFKDESIAFSYNLLTKEFWIDPRKIAVTVFEWDKDAPRDDYSAEIWEKTWIPKERISYLPKEDNWWGPAGQTWPCGPDSEIFYWVWDSEFPPAWSNVATDEDNWMEIWNNVFMEYIKDENWEFKLADQQNVDTWMGLERITAVLNGKTTVYDTDIFSYIIEKIEEVTWVKYTSETKRWIRIISDHVRSWVIMISDWISPSNVDQGYILRRLLRRAIREAYKLDFKGDILAPVAEVIIENYSEVFSNIMDKKDIILEELQKEETWFKATLEKWLKEFEKLVKSLNESLDPIRDTVKSLNESLEPIRDIGKSLNNSLESIRKNIAWNQAFKLYDTFGFPIEMTSELALEKWLTVDREWFEKAFEEHQAKSRVWAQQKFKWGLADDSEATTALHTATHLMLAWLRKYLWNDVHQAGSNITAERLRFDFTYWEKVSKEILDKVEEYVNDAISAWASVKIYEMEKEQAMKDWVEGSFWEKYPDIVKVYSVEWNDWTSYSKELCWGPHVENTSTMWTFKIKKEEASSRWVRRIKAVLIKD